MTPNAPSDAFREQLSAWHDGALDDEPARFIARRLLQDEVLRDELGRWQAIGDVLRRQPVTAPAAGFADRVAAGTAEASITAVPPVSRWRAAPWWATAAGLGLAAVLVWPAREPQPAEVLAVAPAIASMPVASVPAHLNVPVATVRRAVPMPRLHHDAPLVAVAPVPPLVRAPQPTAEQLAPLPAIDAPSRPWPRSAAGMDPYTVEYRVPNGASPRP